MTPASRHRDYLRTTSDSLGIHIAGFLAEEISDDNDNDGVNVDEQQQQQHSGPTTSSTAAADATSARSATCEVCLLVRHSPVRHFQVVHFHFHFFQSPRPNDLAIAQNLIEYAVN